MFTSFTPFVGVGPEVDLEAPYIQAGGSSKGGVVDDRIATGGEGLRSE